MTQSCFFNLDSSHIDPLLSRLTWIGDNPPPLLMTKSVFIDDMRTDTVGPGLECLVRIVVCCILHTTIYY